MCTIEQIIQLTVTSYRLFSIFILCPKILLGIFIPQIASFCSLGH